MYARKGVDVKIYANTSIRVNGGELKQLIDPDVDLASVKWQPFKHSEWLRPSKPNNVRKESEDKNYFD